MANIKFGTDGWRAIIAKDYTIDNVKRVSEATAQWMLKRKMNKVIIGYDCRFGGKMFSEITAGVFCNFGINVVLSTATSSKAPSIPPALLRTLGLTLHSSNKAG